MGLKSESTWVEVNVGGNTRSDVGYAQRPGHGLLVIKHLKLINVGVTKELARDGAFIPTKQTKKGTHHTHRSIKITIKVTSRTLSTNKWPNCRNRD